MTPPVAAPTPSPPIAPARGPAAIRGPIPGMTTAIMPAAKPTTLPIHASLGASPTLQIVRPVVSQMDGGSPEPPGFENVAGETLWVMCRVAGYTISEDEKVHLKYSVQAFDSKGLPLDEPYTNEMKVEVSPQ